MTWQELDIETMTNLYLYGTLETPSNKADETLIREDGYITEIQIDNIASYMSEGPGRFALGSNISVVKEFMNGGVFDAPGEYKAGDYFNKDKKNLIERGVSYQQYLYSDTTADLTERTYVYNSSPFVLNPEAVFVVKADGTREIRNYVILPLEENFDFKSDDGAAKLLNPTLKDWIDPSGIGRRVNIFLVPNVLVGNAYENFHVRSL